MQVGDCEAITHFKEPLTYYKREPYIYLHLGDFFICPMGCINAFYDKKQMIKQHLLEAHSDADLKKWGFSKKNLKFELLNRIEGGSVVKYAN